jgi:nucleotide-binding universal stress UspA family protein
VGMIIDPVNLVAGTTVILLAATFTAQSLGGKLIAAIGVGKYLKYDKNEIGAMFSLTSAEAAATLAAVFVGMEVGLFGTEVIEAVVIVILVTCFVSTVMADRYAPRIDAPEIDKEALGRNVIVPVANPQTAHRLTELAARIADEDTGTVYPVTVLGLNADREQVIQNSKLLTEAEKNALQLGVEAKGSVRIDDSAVSGTLHQIIEHDGTALVMGWKGFSTAKEHLFGGITDTLAKRVDVPILLSKLDGTEPPKRIILHLGYITGTIEKGGKTAFKVTKRLSESYGIPLTIIGKSITVESVQTEYKDLINNAEFITDTDLPRVSLVNHSKPGDMIVVPAGPGGEIFGPEKIAASLPDKDLIISIGS